MLNRTSTFMLHFYRPSYMYNNPFLCCMPSPLFKFIGFIFYETYYKFQNSILWTRFKRFWIHEVFRLQKKWNYFYFFSHSLFREIARANVRWFFFFDSPKVKSYILIVYKCTHKVASIIRYWILKKFYCTGKRQTCIRFTILKKKDWVFLGFASNSIRQADENLRNHFFAFLFLLQYCLLREAGLENVLTTSLLRYLS